MENFQSRLDSLESWPKRELFNRIEQFAELFYFDPNPFEPNDDRLQCVFCPLNLGDWTVEDNPFLEHAKYGPTCPGLLAKKGSEWIRSHKYARPSCVIQQMHQDNGLALQPLLVDSKRPEFCAQSLVLTQAVGTQYVTPRGVACRQADHPPFADFRMRTNSIRNCQRHSTCTKRNFYASAGYFCSGGPTCSMKCYYCSAPLQDVRKDPFKQHARANPQCFHLIMEKGEENVHHIGSAKMNRVAVQEEDINTNVSGANIKNCPTCRQLRKADEFLCCIRCRAEVCQKPTSCCGCW